VSKQPDQHTFRRIGDQLRGLAVGLSAGTLSEEEFVAELLRIDARKLRPYGLTLSVSQTPDDWTAVVMKHSHSHQLCAAFEFQPEKRRVRPFRFLYQYPLRARVNTLAMAA